MAKPFEVMQRYYRQRDLVAREWKRTGGKVVGYLCDNVPIELIMTAGCFPYRITGNPLAGTDKIDHNLEPVYEEFVRSAANMLLTGAYDFLDLVILSRARDSIAQLYSHLHQIQSLDPSIHLPELYALDLSNNRSYQSQYYNLARMRDLKKKLEAWTGKEISNNSLARAIAITNENRRLLKRVANLRAADPPRISGVQALQIIGAAMFMHKEEHNELLKEFLAEADDLPTRDGARLFVEASPLDNLQLYELFESCNATIVGEDHCWGNRFAENLIDPSLDPLEAIAHRYQFKSPGPEVVFPAGLRAEYTLQKTLDAQAQGVLFYIYEWDTAQVWDYPEQDKALKAKGIPAICFMAQKYLIVNPAQITGILIIC